MIEYRLQLLPDALRMILEEAEAFIGEEEFKGQKTYLIYSSDDISDILKELNIPFESKDTEETGWQEKWKEYIQEDYSAMSQGKHRFCSGSAFQNNAHTARLRVTAMQIPSPDTVNVPAYLRTPDEK